MWRALPLLLLAGLLSGCQDQQARERNARLEARVSALEAQVKALEARPDGTDPDSGSVVLRAAAQNCANDLTRFLESTREDTGAYPARRFVTLPDSCVDLRVNWRTLNADAYAFDVTGTDGRTLASGSGP